MPENDDNPVTTPEEGVAEDGTIDEKVFFEGTQTRIGSDGRTILTDSVLPGDHLVRNKVKTSEELSDDMSNNND